MHIRVPIFLFETMPLDDLDRLIIDAESAATSPYKGDLAVEFLLVARPIREAMMTMDQDIRQQIDAGASTIDHTSTRVFLDRCGEIAEAAQGRLVHRLGRWL